MRFLLLENGRIMDGKKTVVIDNCVPCFEMQKDGTSTISKIKVIYEDNSLEMVKQKLIEYCEGKNKVEVALWVKNIKNNICVNPLKKGLKISNQITKENLIVQLINLNEMFLNGEYLM